MNLAELLSQVLVTESYGILAPFVEAIDPATFAAFLFLLIP